MLASRDKDAVRAEIEQTAPKTLKPREIICRRKRRFANCYVMTCEITFNNKTMNKILKGYNP